MSSTQSPVPEAVLPLAGIPRAEQLTRRRFLTGVAAGAGGIALGGLSSLLAAGRAGAMPSPGPIASPYGPLALVADRTTGLTLLKLPAGFEYVTVAWTGDPMDDGSPAPDRPDGMGAFRAPNGRVWIVRNHERLGLSGSFAPASATYDPIATGGTTTLEFDPLRGRLVRMFPSLSGTLFNCAGGATPWRSWLSCEEIVLDTGAFGFERAHGYVFEVPAGGLGSPVPLRGLGRFKHEAALLHPASGVVYLTEDDAFAGFYRFVPNRSGQLAGAGRLEMLGVVGHSGLDMRRGHAPGTTWSVRWVPIAEPDPANAGGAGSTYLQGFAAGGATFTRLEGITFSRGLVYFDSTSGGDVGEGQIFVYDPAAETLRLVYESPGRAALTGPDGLAASPRGGIVVCEDGSGVSRMHGLLPDGRIFPFAENAIVLNGHRGITGDFTGDEFTGAVFDPTGKWLLVNNQTPGITFAITGPWQRGAI